MLMAQNQPWCYLAPEIEVETIEVERGFIGSLESPEPDGEL